MCGDSPPPAYKGPGDAHSNQEWIWQRERYLDLFDEAPEDALRGESTPFYLYNRDARRRIAADRPGRQADRGAARPGRPRLLQLDAPVDGRPRAARRHRRGGRARAEAHRRRLGAVLALPGAGDVRPPGRRTSSTTSRASRCCCCATRRWSTSPDQVLNRVFALPRASRARRSTRSRRTTHGPSSATASGHARVGPVIRAGATVGPVPAAAGLAHGQQAADQPAAQGRATRSRPKLTPEQRELLLAPHLEDIALLEQLTGESFEEWRTYRDGGSFESRRSAAAEPVRRPVTSGERRHQVVRPVGAGQLEVEAGRRRPGWGTAVA